MALDEEQRFDLWTTFREQYGDERAEAMMDAYPPAGLGEPVREPQIELLRAELRTEMADLRTELRTEMATCAPSCTCCTAVRPSRWRG